MDLYLKRQFGTVGFKGKSLTIVQLPQPAIGDPKKLCFPDTVTHKGRLLYVTDAPRPSGNFYRTYAVPRIEDLYNIDSEIYSVKWRIKDRALDETRVRLMDEDCDLNDYTVSKAHTKKRFKTPRYTKTANCRPTVTYKGGLLHLEDLPWRHRYIYNASASATLSSTGECRGQRYVIEWDIRDGFINDKDRPTEIFDEETACDWDNYTVYKITERSKDHGTYDRYWKIIYPDHHRTPKCYYYGSV